MSGNGEDVGAPVTLLLDIKEALGIVQAQNASITSEQNEARASRRLMHAKQDELGAEIRDVSVVVKRIEPLVTDHEKLRQQLTGGATVIVSLGAVVMIVVGFVLKDFWAWLWTHLNWK
jgi:hypothetical protein